jgi:hypothetical protein
MSGAKWWTLAMAVTTIANAAGHLTVCHAIVEAAPKSASSRRVPPLLDRLSP